MVSGNGSKTMKTFGQLFVGGVATILLLKLLATLLLPMVAVIVGFLGLMAKLALITAGLLVVLAVLRRRSRVAQRA